MQQQKENWKPRLPSSKNISRASRPISATCKPTWAISKPRTYRVGQKLASAKARLRGRPAPAPAVVHVPEPVQDAVQAVDAQEVIAELEDDAVLAVVVDEAAPAESRPEPVRPLAAAQPAPMVDIIVRSTGPGRYATLPAVGAASGHANQ
ncbi:hypothetical protein [Comamonas sp. JC664]|uniref:hypothetical protein n=1 Tax=Comamonas sp. JC664 TaxID=2801917 RepID=UPI00361E7147